MIANIFINTEDTKANRATIKAMIMTVTTMKYEENMPENRKIRKYS